jgi:hypothetical protein
MRQIVDWNEACFLCGTAFVIIDNRSCKIPDSIELGLIESHFPIKRDGDFQLLISFSLKRALQQYRYNEAARFRLYRLLNPVLRD